MSMIAEHASETAQAAAVRHEHYPWCDLAHCMVEEDYASHYGPVVAPTIDDTDTDWRCAPSGTPEIQDRRFDIDGHSGVELNLGDTRRSSTSGSIGMSWLTPSEARTVASILVRLADEAEGGAR